MVKDLYNKFEAKFSNILESYGIYENKFAVAVSGGADSLALCFLLKDWAVKNNKEIVALTIDHQLREESSIEANFVHDLLNKNGIEHHILTWEGEKPKTSIEEHARNARYNLLIDFCNSNNINSILLAHHKKDQAETFLMRLQRGSGVDGLSAMGEVYYKNQIKLIRPLLDVLPDVLKEYLSIKEIKWFDDPMNDNKDFLRVRYRKNLELLKEEFDIDIDCLVNTAKTLSRARDYLEIQTNKAINSMVKWDSRGFAKLDRVKFTNLHDEISYRVLARILVTVGGSIYAPRFNRLNRLYNEIKSDDFAPQTLNGVKIKLEKNRICFYREISKVEKIKITNKEFTFDNRFNVKLLEIKDDLYFDVLGEDGWKELLKTEPEYKKKKINYDIKTNLLAIKDENNQILEVFELDYYKYDKIIENISFKPLACGI